MLVIPAISVSAIFLFIPFDSINSMRRCSTAGWSYRQHSLTVTLESRLLVPARFCSALRTEDSLQASAPRPLSACEVEGAVAAGKAKVRLAQPAVPACSHSAARHAAPAAAGETVDMTRMCQTFTVASDEARVRFGPTLLVPRPFARAALSPRSSVKYPIHPPSLAIAAGIFSAAPCSVLAWGLIMPGLAQTLRQQGPPKYCPAVL